MNQNATAASASENDRLFQIVGLLPITVLAILFAVTAILGIDQGFVFASPTLLLVLNIVFLTVTGFVTSAISIRSYLDDGSPTLLLLGMATATSGLAGLFAGLAASLSVNQNVAIYNGILLFAGGLQLLSAILTVTGVVPTPRSSRKRTAPLGYIAVIGLILATVGLVLAGYAPLFFDTSGPTLTRQWVIGIDIVFFATSGLLLAWQYLHTRSRVLYWYSLALLTFALALFGAAIYMVPNGFLNWLARIGQYLGGLYFLAAVLSSRMRVEAAAFPENISWTNAFRNDIKLYDTFFENIGSGFAYGQVISKNGNPVDWVYLDVNAAFESMLGKSRKEVIGKKATEVFPLLTTDPVEWIKIYGNVALTGKQKVVENYSQDLQKWYRVFVYSPRRSFFVAIFEDVTERKKAEEALKLAQEKLQEYATGLERLVEERTKQLHDSQRLAAIGQTAGMVGHDIRNPLQAIVSELYFAKESMKDVPKERTKQAIESIDFIQEQVDYISKIVADLQDYTRPLKAEFTAVAICGFISNSINSIKIPENVEVEITCEEQIPPIKIDKTLTARILTNLVTNAIQAMPEGGKLTIKTSKHNDSVIITVEDTGVGIPEDVQAKMFAPLFTTKAKGQGFGLPVVKRFVEAQDGTISFDSEVGKGTKFIVTLPYNR